MKTAEKIYNQIEDKLDLHERKVLCSIFEIGENRAKTEDELKRITHCDGEGIREIIRSALKKCEKEIKEMQQASKIFISSNIGIKMGDIVEVTMQLGEPELDKETNELHREYNFAYYHNDEVFANSSFEAEDGCFDNSIYDYTEENIENDTGISEYEIIDFYDEFVKLRVKCIGKSWRTYEKNKSRESKI